LQLTARCGGAPFIELASSAGWESSEATIPLFSARARAGLAKWCMPVERQSTPAAGDGDGSDVARRCPQCCHTSRRFGVPPTGVAIRRRRKTRLYHPVSKFDTTSAGKEHHKIEDLYCLLPWHSATASSQWIMCLFRSLSIWSAWAGTGRKVRTYDKSAPCHGTRVETEHVLMVMGHGQLQQITAYV
jgi:hypothetical protein